MLRWLRACHSELVEESPRFYTSGIDLTGKGRLGFIAKKLR
jgi:hypothetical protein